MFISTPADKRSAYTYLAVAMALLSAVPFAVSYYPVMTDYPSHLARYVVMLNRASQPLLRYYYDFSWQISGNLGVDLLMMPLGSLLGAERAAYLIALVIPPLTGLGIIAVLRALDRPIGPGPLLAFAFIWSPALAMGFLNFCLALALALFAFAGWVRMGESRARPFVFVPVSLVVWLCHVSGWGVFGILAFGYELHRQRSLKAVITVMPLAFPLLAIALTSGHGAASSEPWWAGSGPIYKLHIWGTAMRDQLMWLDLLSLAVVLGALVLAIVSRRMDGRLSWAAAILLVLTILMPRHFGGGDFADYRLVSVDLLVGCMAINWAGPWWASLGAPMLFLVRLIVTTGAWSIQSDRLDADLGALAYVPTGSRVASAVLHDKDAWHVGVFDHAASYATVRRSALVNTHFALPGIHMLRLRQGPRDFIDPSQRLDPAADGSVDLSHFLPAQYADYLWYFGKTPPSVLPVDATVVFRSKDSLLLRLARHASVSGTS